MSENGQVTPDVTEEEERRKRPVGAWLRIGIAGAAIIGIGAGLTSALWTDHVAVEIKGEASDELALWVREAIPEDSTTPDGTGADGWAKSASLEFKSADIVAKAYPITPGKTYSVDVDVYNASTAGAVVEFAPGIDGIDLGVASVTSSHDDTIPAETMETYTITLDTSGLQLKDAGKPFTITATYTGIAAD